MKRLLPLILALLLVLVGCAYEEPQTVYTVGIENVQLTVDTQNQTISDGLFTYHYTITATGNSSKITITYPNGATYYWTWSGNAGHGGWSEDYDDSTYADGRTLRLALEHDPSGTKKKRERSGNPLLGLLAIGLGIWNTGWPYSSWYLSHGWYYKDTEPSDAALAMTRFGGIISIIIGIILLLV